MSTVYIHNEDSREQLIEQLRRLPFDGRKWVVSIERPNRTSMQNRMYWEWVTQIVNEYGDWPAEFDQDTRKNAMHDIFKKRMFSVAPIHIFGQDYEVPAGTTTKLKTDGFSAFMNLVERDANNEGIILTTNKYK